VLLSQCDQLGFPDVGVSVGDCISQILLVASNLLIAAVEGAPATAACSRVHGKLARIDGTPFEEG
jgi:hypothetical protein